MRYSHETIFINQRSTALSAIMTESAVSFSDFEAATFSFIRSWLSNADTFMLRTSGSTGTPKEITLTRQQLAASANRTMIKLNLSEKDTALVCLDTQYIAGKMMLVRALEADMRIVAVEPSANPLKNLTVQPAFAAFVPLQLDEMVRHEDSLKKLNQFKSIIIGGAAVSKSLQEKMSKLSCEVYATYGMTETVSHIALQKLNGADAQDFFETLPDIRIRIDERGCLVIILPDFNEPVITNDLVNLIDDSRFEILGRHDNIINSGGIKLIPETIEKKIEPLLREAFFVTGVNDERLGRKLVLIVEGRQKPELEAVLKDALSAYEVPKEILYIDTFVRTDTQKINRAQTLEKALKSES